MMSDEVEELRAHLTHLEERVTELERRLEGDEVPDVDEGLRGFVESFNPTSHTQRALSIAYYLENFRDNETFTVADIEEGYRECRVKPASNMSDVLGRMEGRDWLLRDGTEGQTQLWRLTATALETVEEGTHNDT